MDIKSMPDRISTKDRVLCIPFGLSALLAFALSFSLFQPEGRPYLFLGCLVLCTATFMFIEKKRDVALASVLFILLRLAWSAMITGLQALHLGAK